MPPLVLDGDNLERLANELLPRPFRINPEIALPDKVPMAWLAQSNGPTIPAAMLSRRARLRVLESFSALDPRWLTSQDAFAKNVASIYEKLRPAISQESGNGDSSNESLELARTLLWNVANVDPGKLRELYKAVENGREGYANGLVQKINEQLAKQLNFPKWWVQDRDFSLRLDLRESDLVFTVRDRTGTDYTFSERSSGLRYFLSYYVQYKAHVRTTDHSEILLMDEPDAYLSAEAQQDLLKIFRSFAKPDQNSKAIQVVYVTHSPFLIDKNHSERIRVFEKGSGREGTRVVVNATQNHYEPLRSAFGAFVGETAFVGNCNLVLEGSADQILIAGATNLIVKKGEHAASEVLDLNRITLVPAGSAGHIPYVVYLTRGRDAHKPAVLVLLDSDEAGRNAAEQLRRAKISGAKLLDERYILFVSDVKDLQAPRTSTIEIEDLVPSALAVRAANRYLKDLTAFRDEAAPELVEGDVTKQIDKSIGIFDAIQRTVSELSPTSEWHVEKIGFARSVIECAAQELDGASTDDATFVFLENMKKLFSELNRRKRSAEREVLEERIEAKIERLKNTFKQDHPASATREEAGIFFEELEEVLDSSKESEAIRAKLLRIRREFELDDDVAKDISDFQRFLDDLDALKYAPEIEEEIEENESG